MRNLLNVILTLGIIWGIVAVMNTYKTEQVVTAEVEEKPMINFKAPSFTLHGIDNKPYVIRSSLKKPVV